MAGIVKTLFLLMSSSVSSCRGRALEYPSSLAVAVGQGGDGKESMGTLQGIGKCLMSTDIYFWTREGNMPCDKSFLNCLLCKC